MVSKRTNYYFLWRWDSFKWLIFVLHSCSLFKSVISIDCWKRTGSIRDPYWIRQGSWNILSSFSNAFQKHLILLVRLNVLHILNSHMLTKARTMNLSLSHLYNYWLSLQSWYHCHTHRAKDHYLLRFQWYQDRSNQVIIQLLSLGCRR